MGAVDLLLNLAALVMWLSWRGVGATEAAGSAGTILGNLRSAGHRTQPRWGYLVGLLGLLLVRALIYRQVGPALYWHPTWSAGAVTLSFRSDSIVRMLVFSFVGFGWFLLATYTWAIGILIFNRAPHDKDGVTRAVRRQFGWVGVWPPWLTALLPWLAGAAGWLGVGSWAASQGVLPTLQGWPHLFQQALLVGVGMWCHWRWLVLAILGLHFLNSYVYLGTSPIWDFVQQTGSRLARPFAWLRLGRLDLSAWPAGLIYFGIPTLLATGFPPLRVWLPGLPAWIEFGILPTLFRHLPWG
jgi:hypothetical protein